MPFLVLILIAAGALTLLSALWNILAASPVQSSILAISILCFLGYKLYEYTKGSAEREEKRKALAAQGLEYAARTSERLESQVDRIVQKHKYALSQEKRRCVTEDAYGVKDYSAWHGQGIGYFIENVLTAELRGSFPDGFANASRSYEACKGFTWRKYARSCIEKAIANTETKNSDLTLSVDDMSGIEYEEHCAAKLRSAGWKVQLTSKTGDQGVDLVAIKGDIRVCIQCKRYSMPVGNKAVQEVSAGVLHWHGTHGVVVTNAGFTRAARELAGSTGVLLVSDLELQDIDVRLATLPR